MKWNYSSRHVIGINLFFSHSAKGGKDMFFDLHINIERRGEKKKAKED